MTVALPGEVLAGLVVCSHDAAVSESAIFDGVKLTNEPLVAGAAGCASRRWKPWRSTAVCARLVYRAKEHFEAPNWSRDGKTFFVNRGGKIYTLPVDGGTPTPLDTGQADRCNNDHGLSPDGRWLAISHTDPGLRQSVISVCSSQGGTPKRVAARGRRTGMAGRLTGRRSHTVHARRRVRHLHDHRGGRRREAADDREGPG